MVKERENNEEVNSVPIDEASITDMYLTLAKQGHDDLTIIATLERIVYMKHLDELSLSEASSKLATLRTEIQFEKQMTFSSTDSFADDFDDEEFMMDSTNRLVDILSTEKKNLQEEIVELKSQLKKLRNENSDLKIEIYKNSKEEKDSDTD